MEFFSIELAQVLGMIFNCWKIWANLPLTDRMKRVSTNSLRGGRANAFALAEYPGNQIQQRKHSNCEGILVAHVDTQLLRGGGANVLPLSGYSETAIHKMGRWKGSKFKEYIWEELANYTDGMSMAMKTKFNFMNTAGNVFRDITEIIMTNGIQHILHCQCSGIDQIGT